MGFLADLVRSRFLPAIVAALGVSFLAAGLLTYTIGSDAGSIPLSSDGTALATPGVSPQSSPSLGPTDTAPPTPIPTASGSLGVLPSQIASSLPLPSVSAIGSPTPSNATATPVKPTARPTPVPTAKPAADRVATRVVVPALDIDLPVIRQPGGANAYPACNVAMYLQASGLTQPGYAGATYLYAHARVGMFLPLLEQSRINNGRAMLGMLVQVYTSDNQYFLYEITEVRRHQVTLTDALAAKSSELWLQTSEGPHGTPGKLQVVAEPISSGAASPSDAHPTPRPVACG
jgi:hypothetical protein